MANTMRKNNLKIQMLAEDRLNSFLNPNSEENSTLVSSNTLYKSKCIEPGFLG